MNTRVATVLTVYGIETHTIRKCDAITSNSLQQCLPFTVLKPDGTNSIEFLRSLVSCNSAYRLRY